MASYLRPSSRLTCSSLASLTSCGSVKRSQAVAASVRAARVIPFLPIVVPPHATACQECPGVPGTQHAVLNPVTGTIHDTSPTSVDPPLDLPDESNTRLM